MYQWHVMFKDLVDRKKIIDQMFAFGSRVCRWGQSCPPINREIVAGGYEPLCFVKFTCIRQFFAVRFKSVCFNIWWENRNLRKVAPHPQPKHKDNQLVSICFHARRLKKNPFEFEVVRWVEGKGCRTHNLHRFTVICGIPWRCWGTRLA